MRCKKVEKLIIEASQTEIDPKIRDEIEAHVMTCQNCAAFREKLIEIRENINGLKSPVPTEQIIERTKALCHNEMIKQGESTVEKRYPAKIISIPKFVWITFGALLILTIIWAIPVLRELIETKVITRQAILIAIIFVQNLMMLLFSPVLLRSLNTNKYEFNFQF